jgi:hypothetical protein
MTDNTEEASNLTRVAGDTQESAFVGRKDGVQGALGTLILCRGCLGSSLSPELVFLGEAGLKGPSRVVRGNVALGAAAIAGVHRDTFTQVLLNERLEWGHETIESDFRGLEAAAQRAGVVALWERLLLGRHLRGPEVVGLFSLGHAIRRNLGICPDEGAIAIKLRPVALHKISIYQELISTHLHSRLAFRS